MSVSERVNEKEAQDSKYEGVDVKVQRDRYTISRNSTDKNIVSINQAVTEVGAKNQNDDIEMTGVIHPIAMINSKNEVTYLMEDCKGMIEGRLCTRNEGDVGWNENVEARGLAGDSDVGYCFLCDGKMNILKPAAGEPTS